MEKIPFGKFGFIRKPRGEWVLSHLKSVVGFAMATMVFVFWSVHHWGSKKTYADYLSAETLFNEWISEQKESKASPLIKLQKILKKHPELHAKYDGRIAQQLLMRSEQGLALGFGKLLHRRVEPLSPHYAEFSRCSLLIGEKKFAEALAQAKQLKETLSQDEKFWKNNPTQVKYGAVLYGYNLLRIAFLELALGNAEEEFNAWQEFKASAGWQTTHASPEKFDPEAYELIAKNFQKNDISLLEFIEHREKVLIPFIKSAP